MLLSSESLPDPLWAEDFFYGADLAVFFVVPFAALIFGVRVDAFVCSREEEYADESLPMSEPRVSPLLRAGHFLCGAQLVAFFVSFVLTLLFVVHLSVFGSMP
jgi:hypothetical protein